MPRGSIWLLAIAVVALAGYVTVRGGGQAPPHAPPSPCPDTVVTTLAPSAPGTEMSPASPPAHAGADPLAAASSLPVLGALPATGASAEAPSSAPREVRFGVVLVQYAGAQGAEAGARSKAAAETLATKLAEQAKSDFKGAVKEGDSGSADDAGRVPRGVLEPQVEAALFSLPPNGVTGAVDTPRGFWIAKRLE